MIHIPKTIVMPTEDFLALMFCIFFIGVAIVCFIWINENEKSNEDSNDHE